jgi:hypothetical protein
MCRELIVFNDRNCPNCGGTILGDGYTVPAHCERVFLVNQTDGVTGITHSVTDFVYCTEAHS